MPAIVTLDQAQSAAEVVSLSNDQIASLTAHIGNVQAQIAALQSINVQLALAAANDQLQALQTALATATANQTAAQATVDSYNQANPGAPLPVGSTSA